MSDQPAIAGDLFAVVIKDNLDRQQDRKASLEQRGLAVVSTSGTLVTLSFGFASFQAGKDGAVLSGLAFGLLAAALLAFVIAALFGLATNSTRGYSYISTKSLEHLCERPVWRADVIEAGRQVAEMNVKSLKVARAHNKTKARLLQIGIGLEVLAIILLGASTLAAL